MKPSQYHRQPADNADALAAELAADMLSFLANMWEQASTDEERLDIVMRYGSVTQQLQHTINKAAHSRQRRSYPGKYERIATNGRHASRQIASPSKSGRFADGGLAKGSYLPQLAAEKCLKVCRRYR